MKNLEIHYKPNPREGFYLAVKIIISIIIYSAIGYYIWYSYTIGNFKVFASIIVYFVLIVFLLLIKNGYLIGYLRGNAIKVGENQLPEIYNIAKKQSKILGLKRLPDVYVLQAGGLLNAFATRFLGSNYIVIYSDVLEVAYNNNIETVEFIVGHELGHIKRKHMQKNMILFPSYIIPFLPQAYSRACEHTCDNIGAALSPNGVRYGLLILAIGKTLYNKVNINTIVSQTKEERSFWTWLAEKISTHPRLTKRISKFNISGFEPDKKSITLNKDVKSDHSKFIPH